MSLPASEITVDGHRGSRRARAVDVCGVRRPDVRADQRRTAVLRRSEERPSSISYPAGGGFVGVHSASDTLYEWPEYGRLVGAYFKEHPWTQQASLIVEDGSHPAAAGLGERFSIWRSSTRSGRTPGPACRCCCGSTPPRWDRPATIRSRGRSRTAADAPTTMRSGTSRRPGATSGSSGRLLAPSGGLRGVRAESNVSASPATLRRGSP